MEELKSGKKSLLHKYEIPIEFLDFSYIKTCKDGKVLEKIVKILRSGEEGVYPQLTKCAEEKLQLLNPESKLFRVEEPLLRKEFFDADKRNQFDNEMKMWINEMKEKDEIVKKIKPTSKPEVPIRKFKAPADKSEATTAVERIKSTDYLKWDKFDADAAELKVDLDDERQREMVELKNKKNAEKTKLIEEIKDEEVDCLSDFEKDYLSLKFKEKGNECFKAKEFDEAIKEYTQSLRIKKTAAAHNNRALVYTNECLKLEPNNVKALIRKGQAFVGQQMYTEANETFEKILEIDFSNQTALTEIEGLRTKLPMQKAFRMTIEEVDEVKAPVKKIVTKAEKLELPETSHVPKLVKNIIIEDATPFDQLLPKDNKQPRKKLILPSEAQPTKTRSLIEEIK